MPYTEAEAQRAEIEIAGARTWADAPSAAFSGRAQAALRSAAKSGRPAYLALSGGGGDGAYGAGLLNGWSETGRRPEFAIVSGVSTGALIAPFAFLGSRYDGAIREFYTSGIAETLLDSPDPFRAVFGSSLFSNDRLRELVSRYITPDILSEVAEAGRRGRLLLVITTNLDSQRPVLWDLTALAVDGSPRAAALFRDVLVGSASIPAVFPPILIDAVADGRPLQELHVDGTITSSVFTLPRSYLYGAKVPASFRTDLYVLMNAKLEPDFSLVPDTAPSIGARTFSTFVKNGSRSDIVATFRVARSAGAGFHLSYIGREFPTANGAGFDTEYMRRLYGYGYGRGRSGTAWESAPPDLKPVPEETAAR